MTMNPISAFTGATADRVLDDPLVNRFCLDVMAEAAAIGAAIGCPIAQSGEDRMAVTRQLGAFRTSMLQDVEARRRRSRSTRCCRRRARSARASASPTPRLDALLGLARLHARTLGCIPTLTPAVNPAHRNLPLLLLRAREAAMARFRPLLKTSASPISSGASCAR